MKPLHVILDEDTHRKLKLRAAENGTTISNIIRDAIKDTEPVREGDSKPTLNKPLPKIPSSASTCKNGHIAVPGNDKCLTKGCRYAL